MGKYIDKDEVVAEIKRRISLFKKEKKTEKWSAEASQMNVVILGARIAMLEEILSFLDTLEVKDVNIWHLQEKEDIYDAVKDWSLQTFVCVMKDGTIQKFIGNLDEDREGHIDVHIDGVNDDYDNVDDIIKWAELN